MYRTAYKRLIDQTPLKLLYGQEATIPLNFRVDGGRVAKVLKFNFTKAKEDQLHQLNKLKEERKIALHHYEV